MPVKKYFYKSEVCERLYIAVNKRQSQKCVSLAKDKMSAKYSGYKRFPVFSACELYNSELSAKTYKEILLFEIEANSHSYTINKIITEKGNKRYSRGVSLTIIALLFSIVLILANKFIGIEKAPAKVQVVNIKKLTGSNSINDSSNARPLLSPSAAENH
jgi:hypothetical protein